MVSASSLGMACSLFQITQLFQLQGLQFLSLHNEREAVRIQITPKSTKKKKGDGIIAVEMDLYLS